jgi:1,4-dihydroxy-2-naphthoate octaprenyltransferase
MRDEESDRKVGKNTLVVQGKKSKAISPLLVTLPWFSIDFALLNSFEFDQYLFY